MRESELPPRRTFVPCFVFSVQFGTKSSLLQFIYRAYVTRILATLRRHDGDDNENVKKATGWTGKTTNLPSLCDYYDWKMPNFTLYGGGKQTTAKFSFSFWTWKNAITLFKRRFRCRRCRRILKLSITVEVNSVLKSDHFTSLGNCPPTPPLSQHFALSEN